MVGCLEGGGSVVWFLFVLTVIVAMFDFGWFGACWAF